ncbi:MAG: KEOPS complex kinase/ATPase Bud32 [Candidatus Heimdallarchaeaceae archaeon]
MKQNDKWGAEANLVKDKWLGEDVIKKIRIPKQYRISQIDEELRNSRTVSESKLLIASRKAGVKTPFIYEIDIPNTTIVMENIEGETVKDVLKNKQKILEKKLEYIKEIGKLVGKLHTSDIIHGDLTTSNIIMRDHEFIFVDFGLGKFSNAVEDKAVDILLIKKCFTSTHTDIHKELFLSFQKGYYSSLEYAKSILKRAVKVEARGRHLKEDQLINEYYFP